MTHEKTKTVELVDGYTDAQGRTHKRVVFGRRIVGRDFFALDADPQAQNPLQYEDLVLWAAIIEFGKLPIVDKDGKRRPALLLALLSLTQDDHDLLVEAHNEFQRITAEGHEVEFIADNKVKLGFGFEQDGVTYSVVEFGKRLTRMHQVEASKEKLKGTSELCYLLGRQITKVSVNGGTAELNGPIPLEMFESLDGADLGTLQKAGEIWKNSFRRTRKDLQGERAGEDSANSDEGNQASGERNTELATGAP